MSRSGCDKKILKISKKSDISGKIVSQMYFCDKLKFCAVGRDKMDGKERSRSWFCVLNNPQELYDGAPHVVAENVLEMWVSGSPTRTGAVAYCVSAQGLIHLHMVLEDSNVCRFSALKKLYPKAHLEPTKGTKEQAEDYINKRGKFEEKGEQVLYIAKFGEIKGNQGARKDFEVIEDLILSGKTPREIMDINFSYRRYEKMIKQAYYDKRIKETPFLRPVKVIWHVGESGSGKSYTAVKIAETRGEDSLYMYTDYENGGLDGYNGEPVLFMDEFRGQMKYSVLLGLLQGYRGQIHARYTNVIPLWNEVHITSVLPPDMVYQNMVCSNRDVDTLKQLMRRINTIVYHYIDVDGKYREYEIDGSRYNGYADLKRSALMADNDLDFDLLEIENLFSGNSGAEQLRIGDNDKAQIMA